MSTDVMDNPHEITTYGTLFFTLKTTTQVRLDSLTMQSHCTSCVIFFFTYVVNHIPQKLQKIESANGGKTRLNVVCNFVDPERLVIHISIWKGFSRPSKQPG